MNFRPTIVILAREEEAKPVGPVVEVATAVINCCSGVEGKEPTIAGPSVIKEQEAMVEGTRLRQLEVRLETMEFGMNHTSCAK